MVAELARDLANPSVSTRRAAVGRISAKSGNQIRLLIADERVLPLLFRALSDEDRIVQRTAARALRPWLQMRPDLFHEVLPLYAANTFDGSYSHVGLYDVGNNRIWVPRFAAVRGHASLLSDGNTDKLLKFEFYCPKQAPSKLVLGPGDETKAHLVIHYILDWDYRRQCLISGEDERRLRLNENQLGEYAFTVVDFYRECRLHFDVAVHGFFLRSGTKPSHRLNIDFIAAT